MDSKPPDSKKPPGRDPGDMRGYIQNFTVSEGAVKELKVAVASWK